MVVAYCINRTVVRSCSTALRKYFPRRVWKGTGGRVGIHTGLDLVLREGGNELVTLSQRMVTENELKIHA